MKPNPVIFVVRHPQTEWNARGLLQGHLDSPLTAKGRDDAEELGRRLAPEGIAAVYASDLGRCVEAATLICRHLGAAPLHTEAALRERNFGELNGRPNEEVAKNLDLADVTVRPPGGETLSEMTRRIENVLDRLLASGANPLLVVTHDGPFRALEKSALHSRLRFIE